MIHNQYQHKLKFSVISFVTLFIIIFTPLQARADINDEEYDAKNVYENSFDMNFNFPELGKQSSSIATYMQAQAHKLHKTYSDVKMVRNNEVVRINIPAIQLFLPNSSELLDNADALLSPISEYLKTDNMYHVLICVYHDNTGSDDYIDQLTEARGNAIFEWYENNGLDVTNLVDYAFGSSEPEYSNDTSINRSKNRRVCIFLVPGEGMISIAKNKKLN